MPRRSPPPQPTHVDVVSVQNDIVPDAAVIDAEAIDAETTEVAEDVQTCPTGEPATAVPTLKVPTGKLADVMDRIGRPAGATIDDLIAATGWQPHTIRAVLSRLRRRGNVITLATSADGRKAYRLQGTEG